MGTALRVYTSTLFRAATCCVAAIAVHLTGAGADARPTFTDVTASALINHSQAAGWQGGELFMTGGVAAGDVDGDGWTDLFFTRVDAPDVLYRNKGDGSFEFEDVSAASGFTANLPTNGVNFSDVDNDGDLDLYLTAGNTTRFYLYINDGFGNFTEEAVTRNAQVPSALDNFGQPEIVFGQGVTVGDYDRDGYLDVFTTDWGSFANRSSSRLLHNRGDAQPGHFDDITAQTGLDVYPGSGTFSYRFTGHFTDLDRDGHTDLAAVSDFQTSQLFWNDGDNTFTDGTIPANVGTDQNGMGTSFADVDGDGDLDWFITAIKANPLDPNPIQDSGNRLYVNNGDRTFIDGTDNAGVRDVGWGWGTSFIDYDNDGDFDLIATNGWGDWHEFDPTTLWENDGAGVFTDVTSQVGINDTDNGRGLVHLDYDNDGDLDVVVVNHGAAPILYRNDGGNDNHYLRIETEGTMSNRDGIGAFITVTPDLTDPDTQIVWEVDGGSSFLSQSERIAHIGLGDQADPVDLVTIEWTSGLVQQFFDVPVDSTLHAVETYIVAVLGDANNDEQVTGADLISVQQNFGDMGTTIGMLSGDANDDGQVTGADLISVQQNFGSVASGVPVPEPAVAAMLVGLVFTGRLKPPRLRGTVG